MLHLQAVRNGWRWLAFSVIILFNAWKNIAGPLCRIPSTAQLREFRSQTRQKRDIRNVSTFVEVTPATITTVTTITCCEKSAVEITVVVAVTFLFVTVHTLLYLLFSYSAFKSTYYSV